MRWLSYSDDEVGRFHPVFEAAANQALTNMGLAATLCLDHHLRTPGNTLIPDFVLRRRETGRWVLAVEIKRTANSIYSTRNQIQAQGYTTTNSDLYSTGIPQYFAIGNLEQTILFAQREGRPPRECRVENGMYSVGLIASMPEADFRNRLTVCLEQLIQRVINDLTPAFDVVWPTVLTTFVRASEGLVTPPVINEPNTPGWGIVRDYFCHSLTLDSSRVLLLRCLLAEYILGVLERFGHADLRSLVPLSHADPNRIGQTVANVLSRLRGVDFRLLFDDHGINAYRHLASSSTRGAVSGYVDRITTPPMVVRELARDRLDRSEFLDGIAYALHEEERLDDRGKVLTDPELASLVAAAALVSPNDIVIDPCCGDGALLDAAYSRLIDLGADHESAIGKLFGVEVDPTLVRLAFLRISLKEPANINAAIEPNICQGDMFASRLSIAAADVILMNPPFRRYERLDPHPMPGQLLNHYSAAVEGLAGRPSVAGTGQQNAFTYYVDYIVQASRFGCRMGIILDNKWYHNQYAAPLRRMLLKDCIIEALIEYPYANLFSGWSIATSVVVCRKADVIPEDHSVKFVRCSLDLGQVSPSDVRRVLDGGDPIPMAWSCREVPQRYLDHRNGWKNYFSADLVHDFRGGLPCIPELFEYGRRGSLAKEEGGMSTLGFPFSCNTFGRVRQADPAATRRYQNRIVRHLNVVENAQLRTLAEAVGSDFHGYAVNNSDTLNSYQFTVDEVIQQPTLEPPVLRGIQSYWSRRKVIWGQAQTEAVEQIEADAAASTFIERFRALTGLDANLMPDEWLFVGLKEPYAGELVIPRKMRSAHRVHVNPFACAGGDRQVRLSSNFVSYCRCLAVDDAIDLDRLQSVRLIAAFLTSSFGQLQFEMSGYNREGCLSVELHHLDNIHIMDPRTLTVDERERILDAFAGLAYPIPSDRLSPELPQRNELDKLWAEVFCRQNKDWSENALLSEVHAMLDDYLLARRP